MLEVNESEQRVSTSLIARSLGVTFDGRQDFDDGEFIHINTDNMCVHASVLPEYELRNKAKQYED